jgi:hypothetical protein
MNFVQFPVYRPDAVKHFDVHSHVMNTRVKVKVSRNRPGQVHGVLGRLRPRVFLTFGTTMVVGRQSYAPAAFTPGEIPGTHF